MKKANKLLKYYYKILSSSPKNVLKNQKVCWYWDGLLNLSNSLKISLITCGRNGDWEGHLQTVQKPLPVSR